MRALKNIDHTFDLEIGDIGCTIRKGFGWSTVSIGDILALWNCGQGHAGDCNGDCSSEGRGQVVGYWVGPFGKLPPSLLAMEHNKSARDMDVLREMMRIGYGNINNNDPVTALVYERIAK